MLSPLDPRLRGPLAADAADDDLDYFPACIEIDVAANALALVDLVDRLGYRAEPLSGGERESFFVDALEPIEITLRKTNALPSGESACDVATLEARMRRGFPSSDRFFLG